MRKNPHYYPWNWLPPLTSSYKLNAVNSYQFRFTSYPASDARRTAHNGWSRAGPFWTNSCDEETCVTPCHLTPIRRLWQFYQRFWPHVLTTIMTSEYVDGLVREYLLYRGFSNSLKTFDSELKSDRDKGLRPDKITEQLMAYVSASDIQGKLVILILHRCLMRFVNM